MERGYDYIIAGGGLCRVTTGFGPGDRRIACPLPHIDRGPCAKGRERPDLVFLVATPGALFRVALQDLGSAARICPRV